MESLGSRIWEINWYQNEWPWPLFRGRVKVTSTIAFHLTLNISETVRDRGLVDWFQRTTNRKWHMGYRTVMWPMTSRDLKRSIRNFNTLRAQYLENSWSYRDSVSTNVLVIPLRGTKSRSPAVFESSRYWALSVLGHEFHLSRSLDVMGYVTIWFPIGHFLLVVLKLSLYL